MRLVVGFLFLGCIFPGSPVLLNAQISQPVLSLELEGTLRPTQIPAFSNLGEPQCDDSGEIYLRYEQQGDFSPPATLVSIGPDGTTRTISLAALSDLRNDDTHVFLFAAAEDGSLHEIARVPDASDQDGASTKIEYATFDADGALRSHSAFQQEFVPSLLLPLPDGSFFASGVTLKNTRDGISESPLSAIFNSEAAVMRPLRRGPGPFASSLKRVSQDEESAAAFDGGIARLGGDGNIYILLPGDHPTVAVVSAGGLMTRELQLQEPFETDVAHDMWVSGNRILIAYEGESDNSANSFLYVLYDAQTGSVISVYHPDFSGTVACFRGGQTISVLVQHPSSGNISLGTVELR